MGANCSCPPTASTAWSVAAARTSTTKLNLAQFERRPGEVLLREDVLGHSLINVDTARLVVAREVELTCRDGVWRVAGIDHGIRARLRRLLPRRFRGHQGEHPDLVEWSHLEPFVGHVPSSRLRLTHRRLGRLHAAQIADLVEAASHEEGEEIMNAVAADKELEADIFEELDEEHQLEFLRERSDEQVAAVLGRMESDDAADLLMELDQDRRLPVLERLPPARRVKVRRLLGYNPQTAGGIMNPDFVSVRERSTVEQALEQVRRSDTPPERTQYVVVVDDEGRLAGPVSVAALVKASGHEPVGEPDRAQQPVGDPGDGRPRSGQADDRLQPHRAAGRGRRRPPDRGADGGRRARADAAGGLAAALRARQRLGRQATADTLEVSPERAALPGIHAMGDQTRHQDPELPRSSTPAAAVLGAPSLAGCLT